MPRLISSRWLWAEPSVTDSRLATGELNIASIWSKVRGLTSRYVAATATASAPSTSSRAETRRRREIIAIANVAIAPIAADRDKVRTRNRTAKPTPIRRVEADNSAAAPMTTM